LRSALLITGTVGAGKTSVAEMVGDLLSEAGVPNAVIDLDWLRRSWPSPAGDRFNLAMELRNLRPVARNYLDAGVVRIVLAGVVETRVDRDRYQDALGDPLSVCRL
jgi:adenylylsulfate kinase